MTANDDTPRRRASLELLRAEASDELAVLIHERLRGGEDPWDFMEDLPSVDELVVLTLRADNIFENGGTNPLEGGAFVVQIAQKMRKHQASGVKLKLAN